MARRRSIGVLLAGWQTSKEARSVGAMDSSNVLVWSGWDDARLLPTLLVAGLTLGGVLVHLFVFASAGDESPVEFEWQAPHEAASTWRGQVLARPSIEPSMSDAPRPTCSSTHSLKHHIVCYDPATGYHLGTFPATLPSEIDVMVQSAADAQTRWAKTTMSQRRRVLRSLLDWVVDDAESICRVAARDTGKMSAPCPCSGAPDTDRRGSD